MLWDASQAYGKARINVHGYGLIVPFSSANGRYDVAIKSALTAAGGTGFTYPPCSAPAFVTGSDYVQGSQVTFGG